MRRICFLLSALFLFACGGDNQNDGAKALECDTNQELNAAGDACICVQGTQDNDGDGTCTASCSDATCSGGGGCDDSSGIAVCTCDALRTGENCESCVSGFDVNGDQCSWVGGIVKNTSFTDATAWTLEGHAEIADATDNGRLPSCAFSSAGGAIRQVLEMPPASVHAPLVLRFKAWYVAWNSLAVGLGDTYWPANVVNGEPSEPNNEFCLGEGSMGSGVELVFQPGSYIFNGSGCFGDVYIDDVEIVYDETGACPQQHSFANGNFDGGSTDWSSVGDVTFSDGQAVLQEPQPWYSTHAELSQTVVVPGGTETPGVAIEIVYKTSNSAGGSSYDSVIDVEIERNGVFTTIGSFDSPSESTFETTRICMHPYDRSKSMGVKLSLRNKDWISSTVYPVQATVDSIRFVDEPGCQEINGVVDGDFETSVESPVWSSTSFSTTLTKETGDASSGSQYMAWEFSECYESITLKGRFPQADNSSALVFDYRFDDMSAYGITGLYICDWYNCYSGDVMTAAADWTEHVICIDSAGHADGLMNEFYFYQNVPVSCSGPLPAQKFQIDNVRAMAHPACE